MNRSVKFVIERKIRLIFGEQVYTLLKGIYSTVKKSFYFIKLYGTSFTIVYYHRNNNFGDELNSIIADGMFHGKWIHYNDIFSFNKKVVSMIGSILDEINIKNLVVWGSGFISENSSINSKELTVISTRGPLTQKIIQNYCHASEIYGDPALLLPYFLKVEKFIKYDLGIIPHYIHKNSLILREIIELNVNRVVLIDVNSNPTDIINKMNNCKAIMSSSLHGLIISDAYEIPSIQVVFSDCDSLDQFKFKDYYEGVRKNYVEPLKIDKYINIDEILLHIEFNRPIFDAEEYIKSYWTKVNEFYN